MVTSENQLINTINTELEQCADPAYRELVRTRYNMNVDNFLGVRTPQIHKIAGIHYKPLKTMRIEERLAFCESLLKTGVYEHKIIAFRWAYLSRKDFNRGHLAVFETWLEAYVDDWIDCDDLCIHVIGEYLLRYPEKASEVISWTKSNNLWVRRGAAVSLVLPVRKGNHLELAFRVADQLLNDQEDLVLKSYGWLLKVASKHYPEDVFHYVMDKREKMPRVALRYAIEKLPKEMQQQAMEKK